MVKRCLKNFPRRRSHINLDRGASGTGDKHHSSSGREGGVESDVRSTPQGSYFLKVTEKVCDGPFFWPFARSDWKV